MNIEEINEKLKFIHDNYNKVINGYEVISSFYPDNKNESIHYTKSGIPSTLIFTKDVNDDRIIFENLTLINLHFIYIQTILDLYKKKLIHFNNNRLGNVLDILLSNYDLLNDQYRDVADTFFYVLCIYFFSESSKGFNNRYPFSRRIEIHKSNKNNNFICSDLSLVKNVVNDIYSDLMDLSANISIKKYNKTKELENHQVVYVDFDFMLIQNNTDVFLNYLKHKNIRYTIEKEKLTGLILDKKEYILFDENNDFYKKSGTIKLEDIPEEVKNRFSTYFLPQEYNII